MTVRDTIGDLPPVENGASKPTIQVYISHCPVSYVMLRAELTLLFGPVWKRTCLLVPEEDSRRHGFTK
jgi:hypothetical protein